MGAAEVAGIGCERLAMTLRVDGSAVWDDSAGMAGWSSSYQRASWASITEPSNLAGFCPGFDIPGTSESPLQGTTAKQAKGERSG